MHINGIIWIIINLIGLVMMWIGNAKLENRKSLSGFFMILSGLALMLFSVAVVESVAPLLASLETTMPMPNINIFK